MMRELSMHVLDIFQNSVVAGATLISVSIAEERAVNKLTISIADNGKGMSPELVSQVRSPFTTSRTTRNIGLGIPMLEQTCMQCGGGLVIESEPGVGTIITAEMEYNNIDRPPLGDIGGDMYMMIVTNPTIDIVYTHNIDRNIFEIDTREIKEVLGTDVDITAPAVMEWVKETIAEGLAEL